MTTNNNGAVKLKPLYREAQINPSEVDEEKRVVEFSFSSEMPVERYWGVEILDHSPKSVRLDRLRNAAPLLSNHDPEKQIGVVESAEIRNGKGYAKVRFSRGTAGQAALDDVKDGILRNVSVGYRDHVLKMESEKDGQATYRVTDWEPFEVSLVSIPADTSVGIGRNVSLEENEATIERQNMPEDTKTEMPPGNDDSRGSVTITAEDVKRQLADERSRISDITTLGREFRADAEAKKAVDEGHSADQFRAWIIENRCKGRPVASSAAPLHEMEKDAKRRYSLMRVINAMCDERKLDGFEGEVAQELGRVRGGRAIKGALIPSQVLGIGTRTLSAAVPSAGGYTVATDLMGEEFIAKLDNMPVVERAGARRLTGLVGDVAIPRQSGGATAYWLSESGTVTDSEPTFDLLGYQPHRLQVSIPWTKQLAMQSSLDVEALLRQDANLRIALAIDKAAFQGLGASGEPKGLFSFDTSTSGINTVTYSAAATFAKTRDQIASLLSDNSAGLGSPSFIISPSSWAKWSTKSVDTGSGVFLWQGSHEGGTVGGYPGYVSNHLPSDKSVCGVFNQMMLLYWEGVDVIVDPYTLKKQGIVEISTTMFCDIGVRYTEAFVVSTDSAAQ